MPDEPKQKLLLLVVPWFGPWPEWINLTLESCRWNPTVDWLFVTDQAPPENNPGNVNFLNMTMRQFAERVSGATGQTFEIESPYKVADSKPMLGHTFVEELAGYRNWGYGDLDVIYGSLGTIYPEDLLLRYDAISTCADRMSGHLAIFRNSEKMRMAYRRSRYWRKALSGPHIGFDEHAFSRVFLTGGLLTRPFRIRSALFQEMHTTVDTPDVWLDGRSDHPSRWTWESGHLHNDRDGQREFIYLHFMNWKSDRYRRPHLGPAPWLHLKGPLVHMDWRRASSSGFSISPDGFGEIDDDQ